MVVGGGCEWLVMAVRSGRVGTGRLWSILITLRQEGVVITPVDVLVVGWS